MKYTYGLHSKLAFTILNIFQIMKIYSELLFFHRYSTSDVIFLK